MISKSKERVRLIKRCLVKVQSHPLIGGILLDTFFQWNPANANTGLDKIAFNICGGGAQTIQPNSALPDITDTVIIDATTQSGFVDKPIIELDGSSAGGSVNGLRITAGNSTVRGLVPQEMITLLDLIAWTRKRRFAAFRPAR